MTTVENKLSELYNSNVMDIGSGFAEWFNVKRTTALEGLKGKLPLSNAEQYHLLDLPAIYGKDWEYDFTGRACSGKTGAFTVEVCNGHTDGRLTVESDGLIYGSLKRASNECRQIVESCHDSFATADGSITPELINTIFMQDGVFVYLPDGYKATRPIIIQSNYCAGADSTACLVRVLVVAGRDADAQVALIHKGLDDSAMMINSLFHICALPGSNLDTTLFCNINEQTTLLHTTKVVQQEQSRFHSVAVTLNGDSTRLSHSVDLCGEQASTEFYGLYMATKSQKISCDVKINHLKGGCKSFSLVKGIAAGQAIGSFTGKVYVAPQSQRTQAAQQSRNIEISPTCRIYARPQLEIYADDVRCSHGATVGRLDDEAVYYMRQRGIDLEVAQRLQLEGFVTDITSRSFLKNILEEPVRKGVELL